jgi:hypothetical protein
MRLILLSLIALCGTLAAQEDDFDALMGKETSHWSHVKQAQDVETLQWAKTLYQKNKPAQFVKEGPFKIPPVIHFIWLGPRSFPPESVQNVRTWIAQNPGWKVKFWTDREREPPCLGMETVLIQNSHFAKLGKCYEASQNWGEKSDLLRYEILSQEGGVYVDHDANCLQPFHGMHRGYDLYCCLETPHTPFVGKAVTCGNGVIGAKPGHPTIQRVIDLIHERWDGLGEKYQGRDDYSRIEVVMQRTYIALTHALPSTVGQGNNTDIVLPAAYFFAKSGISPLYSEHFYASAWDDFKVRKSATDQNAEKSLGKIRRKNQNLSLLIMGLIALNGGLFFWVRKQRG